MGTLWRIEMLGGLRAVSSEREVKRFATRKTGSLLAFLAFHIDRLHPRDSLLAEFWPDADEASARASLRVAISSLRRQLEQPGIPLGSVLLSEGPSIRLNPAAVSTDVSAFAHAIESSQAASGIGTKVAHLTRAVDLYRGELLPGFYENWVIRKQQELSDTYVHALRELTQLLEETGDSQTALRFARLAVEIDPLWEAGHREIIRLLAATGESHIALRQYEELKAILLARMGAAPSSETEALVTDIVGRAGVKGSAQTPASRVSAPVSYRTPERSGSISAVSGTVTLLLIELAASGRDVLRDADLLHLFERAEGQVIRRGPRSFVTAFRSARSALDCSALIKPLNADAKLVLYTGDIDTTNGGTLKTVLLRAQRLLTVGHPGQTLCSEPTVALLRHELPKEWHLKNLGSYLVAGEPEPVMLFQSVAPGEKDTPFPELIAEPAYGDRIPLSLSRFFGRQYEMDRLTELLVPGGERLVTLTGPGGSGKTRLAIEVTHRLRTAYRGRIWFADVVGVEDAQLLPETIRATLGIAASPSLAAYEQIAYALAKNASLLVVDNFEQIVEHGAPFIAHLLGGVPSLVVLITSRRHLELGNESVFPVGPLRVPNSDSGLESIADCDSVRLFLDRAQRVRPDFQLTPRNAQVVAGLCERLEGIPLALELAAARAGVLTPSQMLEQLDNRFDLLVSRRRDLAARHQTLRATLEWSDHLLRPELRLFVRRLVVFRGGWTVEAAAEVCGNQNALSDLEELRSHSLVTSEQTGETVRFAMLETVREFYLQGITEVDRSNAQARHAVYYAREVETIATEEPEGSIEWLHWMDLNFENLRQALASAYRRDATLCLRLVAVMGSYWRIRGYLAEGREWAEKIVRLPEAQEPTGEAAEALLAAGTIAQALGDYSTAKACFVRSIKTAHFIASDELAARTYGRLAQACRHVKARLAYVRKAYGLYERSSDWRGMAGALRMKGIIAWELGDYNESLACLDRSLEMYRGGQTDQPGLIQTLSSLAKLRSGMGSYTLAQEYAEACEVYARKCGHQLLLASCLFDQADIAFRQGHLRSAQAIHERCLAMTQALGLQYQHALHLLCLGDIHNRLGEQSRAQQVLASCLRISEDMRDPGMVAQTRFNLGWVAMENGDLSAARSFMAPSVSLRCHTGEDVTLADTLLPFARLLACEEQYVSAVHMCALVSRLRKECVAPLTPCDQPQFEALLITLRNRLGEPAFTSAWERAFALSKEQIVAEALQGTSTPSE